MARRKDPGKIAEKWRSRLAGSTQEIKDGVNAVNTAPGELAAAAEEKMRTRLLARIEDGTWARRVAAVSLGEWQDAMLTKGVQRIGSGAEAAVPKVEDFHGQLQEHQNRIDAKLEKMGNITLADGIQRMVVQVEEMAKFRKD